MPYILVNVTYHLDSKPFIIIIIIIIIPPLPPPNTIYTPLIQKLYFCSKGLFRLKVLFHFQLKVLFHQRSSSIKVYLQSKIVFHQRSSSIKGHLPSSQVHVQNSRLVAYLPGRFLWSSSSCSSSYSCDIGKTKSTSSLPLHTWPMMSLTKMPFYLKEAADSCQGAQTCMLRCQASAATGKV